MKRFRLGRYFWSLAYWAGLRAWRIPDLLWSKGYGRFCDFAGPRSYSLAPTESTQSAEFFRRQYADACGVVWVRLGTRSKDGECCDLDTFADEVLPTIRRPFALVTTDGDASVPSDLASDTVTRLLDNPFLVLWCTQNCDGSHPKLRSFPIGLDLHTPRRKTTPQGLVRLLGSLRRERTPPGKQPARVFCDLNRNLNSTERRQLVRELADCAHVDFLEKRTSQRRIWKRYADYPLVLSAPGNGLDCHRTYELLYLGCIVITKRSTLDPLYEGLPVVIVDDWREVRDERAVARWIEEMAPMTDAGRIWSRLTAEAYLQPIRQEVEAAAIALAGETVVEPLMAE